MTTTSESKVCEHLARIAGSSGKAFVLTSRIPDDETHVRYDVFMFVKEDEDGH
jgi:hypothetical protein